MVEKFGLEDKKSQQKLIKTEKPFLTRSKLTAALLAGGAALGLWHLNSEEGKTDTHEVQKMSDDTQKDVAEETPGEPDVQTTENDVNKIVLPGNLPRLTGEIKTLGEVRKEKFSQFKQLLHREMRRRNTDESDIMYLNREKIADEELQKSPQLKLIAHKIYEKFPNFSFTPGGDQQFRVYVKVDLDHTQMMETGFEMLPSSVLYIDLNDDGTVRLSDDSARYYAVENIPLNQLPDVVEQYLLLLSAMDAWRNEDHAVAPSFEEYLQILGADNLVTMVKSDFLRRINEKRDMEQEEQAHQKKDLLLSE